MLGMKIYPDTSEENTKKIINYAVQNKMGLELCMLYLESFELCSIDEVLKRIENTPFHEAADHTLHTDNCNTFGCEIFNEKTWNSYNLEFQNARRLGIKKIIMHYNDVMLKEQVTDRKLREDFLLINELGNKYDIKIYIENTLFHHETLSIENANVDFYERLFDIVSNEKLDQIGFCFDLGHGKVFSDNTLAEWLVFIDSLKNKNIPLHFHLHNNHGIHDDHLPFHVADVHGLNKGDSYTGGKNYIDVVRHILDTYDALHMIEVPSHYALDELPWLQAELAKSK